MRYLSGHITGEIMELNQKLAERAGIEYDIAGWIKNPDTGQWHRDLFTESLDACFKWLVPEAINILMNKEDLTTEEAYSKLFSLWLREMSHSEPALALCKVIEELIDCGEDKNLCGISLNLSMPVSSG